jgi:membrane-associated protein
MIEFLLSFFRTLTDPERLMHFVSMPEVGWLGYGVLFAIVFAETGVFLGFFLPGDSLLFAVGVVAGAGRLNIVAVNAVLMAAAVIGDAVGYAFGRRTVGVIFNQSGSHFFRENHLERTRTFYEKHGGKAIIYARFVPIIRTFAPFVAGMARMGYRRFLVFNVIGGIGWVFSLTMLGYALGNVPLVQRHFEKAISLIIFVSVLPALFEMWKARRGAPARRRGGA